MTPSKLIAELREARTAWRAAREKLSEAKAVVAEKRDVVREASARIEEILEEMETGKTGRPILDAIATKNGEGGA